MRARAFTLVEILVTLAMLSCVLCLGLFATADFLQKQTLADARDTLAMLLAHARAESMNNLGGVSHGVCLDSGKPAFAFFSGEYDAAAAIAFPLERSISVSGLPECDSGRGIAFAALSGAATGARIILSQAFSFLEIDVDKEGEITW